MGSVEYKEWNPPDKIQVYCEEMQLEDLNELNIPLESVSAEIRGLFEAGNLESCKHLILRLHNALQDYHKPLREVGDIGSITENFVYVLNSVSEVSNSIIAPMLKLFASWIHFAKQEAAYQFVGDPCCENLMQVVISEESPFGAPDPERFDCLSLQVINNLLVESYEVREWFCNNGGMNVMRDIASSDELDPEKEDIALRICTTIVRECPVSPEDCEFVGAWTARCGDKKEEWSVRYIDFLRQCVRQESTRRSLHYNFTDLLKDLGYFESTDQFLAILDLINELINVQEAMMRQHIDESEFDDDEYCVLLDLDKFDWDSAMRYFDVLERSQEEANLPHLKVKYLDFLIQLLDRKSSLGMYIGTRPFITSITSWFDIGQNMLKKKVASLLYTLLNNQSPRELINRVMTSGVLSRICCFVLDNGDTEMSDECLDVMNMLLDWEGEGSCQQFMAEFVESCEEYGVWDQLGELTDSGDMVDQELVLKAKMILEKRDLIFAPPDAEEEDHMPDDGYSEYEEYDFFEA